MSPGASGARREVLLMRADTGLAVPAAICYSLSADEIVAADAAWRTFQAGALRLREVETATRPEHLHWQQTRKADRYLGLLAYEFLKLVCENAMQGMMLLRTVGSFGRLRDQKGLPLVYVDYLSAAPWNLRGIASSPRFRGVGSARFREAITVSRDNEYRGRLGLHSLPQAESFYRDACGMADLGPDPDAYGLRYFEMSAAQADSLEQRGDSG